MKDFISAAKSANPPFKMGGTGSQREDHVLTVFVEKKTGAKFAYLPYKSGGEAATQLVGNHTAGERQQPLGEPRSVARRAGARAVRVRQGAHLVQDQGHRQAVLERHPDLQGRGLDVQYLMLRAMFLPGKVTPDQKAFYVDLFRKVTQTAEYKDYMEKQALKPVFLTGDDMLKFLEEDDALNKSLMIEAGFDRSEWLSRPRNRARSRARAQSTSSFRCCCSRFAASDGVRQLAQRRRLGVRRPAGGLLPVLSVACSSAAASLVRPRHRRSRDRAGAGEAFVNRDQLRRVMQVLVPTLLFCLFTQWLGLYVASFLLIAGFMRWVGADRVCGSRC